MKDIVTDKLYNEKYCKKINAKGWRFDTIPNVIEVLYNHFKPRSVVDLGCANGIHLKSFKSLGVEKIYGIEGTTHWKPYLEKSIGTDFEILDLRKPIPTIDQFDLAISFEVLEHLEKKYARQAVKNILSFSDTFCISACPLAGGFHHVNVKPREYWIRVFDKLGAKYQQVESEYLQNIFSNMNCSGWFKNSLKVFRK